MSELLKQIQTDNLDSQTKELNKEGFKKKMNELKLSILNENKDLFRNKLAGLNDIPEVKIIMNWFAKDKLAKDPSYINFLKRNLNGERNLVGTLQAAAKECIQIMNDKSGTKISKVLSNEFFKGIENEGVDGLVGPNTLAVFIDIFRRTPENKGEIFSIDKFNIDFIKKIYNECKGPEITDEDIKKIQDNDEYLITNDHTIQNNEDDIEVIPENESKFSITDKNINSLNYEPIGSIIHPNNIDKNSTITFSEKNDGDWKTGLAVGSEITTKKGVVKINIDGSIDYKYTGKELPENETDSFYLSIFDKSGKPIDSEKIELHIQKEKTEVNDNPVISIESKEKIIETKDSQILRTDIINNFKSENPFLKEILEDANNKNLHIDVDKIEGSGKDTIYTTSIGQYSGFRFKYNEGKLELQDGEVRKGLVWFSVKKEISESTNKDNDNNQKDIELVFGDAEKLKTLSYINEKINKNIVEKTQDLGVFQASTIDVDANNIGTVKFGYVNNTIFEEQKENGKYHEEFDIKLDDDNLIPKKLKDDQGEWYIYNSNKDTSKDQKLKNGYDLPENKKFITYLAKTDVVGNEPDVTLINTIRNKKDNKYLFTKEYGEYSQIKDEGGINDYMKNILSAQNVTPNQTKHENIWLNNYYIEENGEGYKYVSYFMTNNQEQIKVELPFTKEGAQNLKFFSPPIVSKNGTSIEVTPMKVDETSSPHFVANIEGIIYDIMIPYSIPSDNPKKNFQVSPEINFKAMKNETYKSIENITNGFKIGGDFLGNKITSSPEGQKADVYKNVNCQIEGNMSLGNIRSDDWNSDSGKKERSYQRSIIIGEERGSDGNITKNGIEIGELVFGQTGKFERLFLYKKRGDNKEKNELYINGNGSNEIEIMGKKAVLTTGNVNITKDGVQGIDLKLTEKKLVDEKDKDKYRENLENIQDQIYSDKTTIFRALKSLSGYENYKGLNINKPKDNAEVNNILGPTANGVYRWKLIEGGENGEQFLYFKTKKEGNDTQIQVTDEKGGDVEKQYIQIWKSYYYAKIKDDGKNLSLIDTSKENSENPNEKLPNVEDQIGILGGKKTFLMNKKVEGDIIYYNIGVKDNSGKNVEVLSLPVNTDGTINDKVGEGVPNMVQENQNYYSSYENIFSGANRDKLGIFEKEYRAAFGEIYSKASAENKLEEGQNIGKVRLYDAKGLAMDHYVILEQNKKNPQDVIILPLESFENATEEMNRRLDVLVKVYNMYFNKSSEIVEGYQINKPTHKEMVRYLTEGGTIIFELAGLNGEKREIEFNPNDDKNLTVITENPINLNKSDSEPNNYYVSLKRKGANYTILLEKAGYEEKTESTENIGDAPKEENNGKSSKSDRKLEKQKKRDERKKRRNEQGDKLDQNRA